MKYLRFSALFLAVSFMTTTIHAQSLKDILNQLGGKSNTNSSSTSNSNSTKSSRFDTQNNPTSNSNTSLLSNTDLSAGLKDALKIGAENAAKQLSATNGYFGNAAIKILLPPQVAQVEQTLRSVGMGSLVDKAVLALNRAAEDAAVKSAPIFVNAITSMSIQDGMSILKGGNNAATTYLQGKTTAALTAAFRPVISASLNKVGAEKLWNTVFKTYNSLPLAGQKVNPDITGYVTERALSGLFTTIGQEELKIRTDPAAQVTNILKKVFGNQ